MGETPGWAGAMAEPDTHSEHPRHVEARGGVAGDRDGPSARTLEVENQHVASAVFCPKALAFPMVTIRAGLKLA